MIFVSVVIDLAIHRGRVSTRDGGGLLVLGGGRGLGLLARAERKC